MCVLGDELRFDELVEPRQVDVGKNRTHDAALWRATQRAVVGPGFEVACPEQFPKEAEKAIVVNVLRQHRLQNRMVQAVETGLDVAFDEPRCSCPRMVDLAQRRVTPAPWSKAV